jgi:Skp family chaperone for outer membrane proteins
VLKADKRKYRRAKWKKMRAEIELSRLIRKIEFTEPVKRRLVEEVKDIVERVSKMQRELDNMKKTLTAKTESRSSRKRNAGTSRSAARSSPLRSSRRPTISRRDVEHLRHTLEVIMRGEAQAEQARRSSSRQTFASWSPSPRNTPTAGCSSWI